jgi:hypothetical protein
VCSGCGLCAGCWCTRTGRQGVGIASGLRLNPRTMVGSTLSLDAWSLYQLLWAQVCRCRCSPARLTGAVQNWHVDTATRGFRQVCVLLARAQPRSVGCGFDWVCLWSLASCVSCLMWLALASVIFCVLSLMCVTVGRVMRLLCLWIGGVKTAVARCVCNRDFPHQCDSSSSVRRSVAVAVVSVTGLCVL